MRPLVPPARVEVDEHRQYIDANESACRLLGYSREELLSLRIDDVSFPSAAHVSPMFRRYQNDGDMSGIFAVRTKTGEGLWIRYQASTHNGHLVADWTEYEPMRPADLPRDLRS